jgi:hypothetical protein
MEEFPEHIIKWWNKTSKENIFRVRTKDTKYVFHFNKNNKKLEVISHFIKLTKKHRRKTYATR